MKEKTIKLLPQTLISHQQQLAFVVTYFVKQSINSPTHDMLLLFDLNFTL